MNRLREKTIATLLIAIFLVSVFAVTMPTMAGTNTTLTVSVPVVWKNLNITIVGGGEVEYFNGTNFITFEGGGIHTFPYPQGTLSDEFTAKDKPGWEFVGWYNETLQLITANKVLSPIQMDDHRAVGVLFKPMCTLTLNIVGGGSVNVWYGLPPEGPAAHNYGNVASTETIIFDIGTVVTMTADPDDDWKFGSWTGDVEGYIPPLIEQVTMTANKTATATFLPKIVSIDVTSDIDFGSPVPGETVTDTITVLNDGELNTDVTAKLENENPANFYTTNMVMDSTSVGVWKLSGLVPLDTELVSLSLSIPNPCPPGAKTATLVFEAVASP